LGEATVLRVHFVVSVQIIGSGKGPMNTLDATLHGASMELHPAGVLVSWPKKARAFIPHSNIRCVELA
jgi:hypothetical protein